MPYIFRISRRKTGIKTEFEAKGHFMRLLKVVVILVILILAGLAGYAYFGDMSSDPKEMRMPVELDLGSAPATAPAPASATEPANAPATEPANAPAPQAETPAGASAPPATPAEGTTTDSDDLD